MPRRARVSLPGMPHHIIQRGNNRSACFYADEDYHFYLEWLAEYLIEVERCDFLTPHELYKGLGSCAENRLNAYRELFRSHLEPKIIDEIRSSTNGNYALGSERFREQVEQALGRRAGPGKPGRPRVHELL